MTRKERAKLQSLINRAAITSAAFHRANTNLMDYCQQRYGCEPGDIDADDIIDGVLGGCGEATGMSADEFDAIMTAGSQRMSA